MKKTIILNLLLCCLTSFLVSCDDNEIKPGGTSVEKMAGDWWVMLRDESGNDQLKVRAKLYTYNTASNVSTEMFVDDKKGFSTLKGKVQVDYKSKTFFTNDFVQNLYNQDNPFKIYEGKILANAGKSKSGKPVDSIYIKLEFKNEPGVKYIIAGTRKTGFPADDY